MLIFLSKSMMAARHLYIEAVALWLSVAGLRGEERGAAVEKGYYLHPCLCCFFGNVWLATVRYIVPLMLESGAVPNQPPPKDFWGLLACGKTLNLPWNQNTLLFAFNNQKEQPKFAHNIRLIESAKIVMKKKPKPETGARVVSRYKKWRILMQLSP